MTNWVNGGVEIVYLTSRRDAGEIKDIEQVLHSYNFPSGTLEHRIGNEEYKDVAERIKPDVLIEDDCESIGGEKEMTYTFISEEVKLTIKSVPVPEFGGIEHLPDDPNQLFN